MAGLEVPAEDLNYYIIILGRSETLEWLIYLDTRLYLIMENEGNISKEYKICIQFTMVDKEYTNCIVYQRYHKVELFLQFPVDQNITIDSLLFIQPVQPINGLCCDDDLQS